MSSEKSIDYETPPSLQHSKPAVRSTGRRDMPRLFVGLALLLIGVAVTFYDYGRSRTTARLASEAVASLHVPAPGQTYSFVQMNDATAVNTRIQRELLQLQTDRPPLMLLPAGALIAAFGLREIVLSAARVG